MAKGFLRGLRADLAISARPACLVVLVLAAVLCGLSSAVVQDAAFAQLDSARLQVKHHVWDATVCSGRPRECAQAVETTKRDTERFFGEQQRVAGHVAALQSTGGAVEYAARFMALGFGALVVALLATVALSREWARRTMSYALAAAEPFQVACRRLVSLFILALLSFGFALVGAASAAAWGRSARPLGESAEATSLTALLGAMVVVIAYCAIASAVAWTVRDTMRTFLFTSVLVGALAFSTRFGKVGPGSSIVSALGMHRLLEIEVGYVWIWPQLTFSADGKSPARVVSVLPWAAAVLFVAAAGAVAVVMMKRSVTRSDPFA